MSPRHPGPLPAPEPDEEELEAAFATLGPAPLDGGAGFRRSCPRCDREFDGAACPDCGLKYRPRCPECGARLAWSRNVAVCPACGAPTPRSLFFVADIPAPAGGDAD